MVSGEHRRDRARRLARRSLQIIGEEFREARLRAGMNQRELGLLAGTSHTTVSRIELGSAGRIPFETLVVIATILGLDLPLRAFPSGAPIRDAAQSALLARFRACLAPTLQWQAEVPLRVPGDRRAWDAVVSDRAWRVPVDAESRLRDVQACSRRTALKRRDDGADVVILLVADTRHNRAVLRLASPDLVADYPLSGREALAALGCGERPKGSAVVRL